MGTWNASTLTGILNAKLDEAKHLDIYLFASKRLDTMNKPFRPSGRLKRLQAGALSLVNR